MKQIGILAMMLVGVSSGSAQNKKGVFTGEIMDKQCAQMQSHDNMMKAMGATNAKDCALKCVKSGGMFALFDSGSKKVYLIDDEKKVRDFAGQRVEITGTYDEGAEVLHIKTITAAH